MTGLAGRGLVGCHSLLLPAPGSLYLCLSSATVHRALNRGELSQTVLVIDSENTSVGERKETMGGREEEIDSDTV